MNNLTMSVEHSDGGEVRQTMASLSVFLTATFVFTWLILGLAALSANNLIPLTLPATALITMATLGPLVGAVTAVTVESSRSGIRPLLAQAGHWRVGGRWYLVVLLGPAVVMVAAYFLWRLLGGPETNAPPQAAWFSIPILLVVLLIPALFEEIGWRGFALPRLQSRFGWLPASLILGIVWAVWHAPIWFIPEAGFSSLPFPVFMLFTMALSVLFTWVFNGTGGSVFMTALAHAAINAYPSPWNTAVYLLPEGARGIHLQIPVTYVLAFLAFALIVYNTRGKQA